MNCDWCLNGVVGQVYWLRHLNWGYCSKCNADVASLFPRRVLYDGKKNGQHLFTFLVPTVCPECKWVSEGCAADCPDEGELLTLNAYTTVEELNE